MRINIYRDTEFKEMLTDSVSESLNSKCFNRSNHLKTFHFSAGVQ